MGIYYGQINVYKNYINSQTQETIVTILRPMAPASAQLLKLLSNQC